MLGDLVKLYDAVQSAETDREKLRRESELNDRISHYLYRMFDDPEFPNRRRTLGALKKGLAIFDDDPILLQTHLVRVGATRLRGDGDDELWHLPQDSAPPAPRRLRRVSATRLARSA